MPPATFIALPRGLADLAVIRVLRTLSLDGIHVTEGAVKKLKASLPNTVKSSDWAGRRAPMNSKAETTAVDRLRVSIASQPLERSDYASTVVWANDSIAASGKSPHSDCSSDKMRGIRPPRDQR